MIKKITGLGHCKDGKSILFRMVIAQKVYYRDKESEANKEIDPSGPVGHDILRVQIQTRDDPLLFSKELKGHSDNAYTTALTSNV